MDRSPQLQSRPPNRPMALGATSSNLNTVYTNGTHTNNSHPPNHSYSTASQPLNTDSNHVSPPMSLATKQEPPGSSALDAQGLNNHVDLNWGAEMDADAQLENELPQVQDGQIPLSDLVSRVAQAVYAELSELGETLPGMSDAARKRTIADWVVKTKKQVVKLYAVVKWARDAKDVQKAMNITAFLMEQNHQFEEAIHGINYTKESLAPARLRNHDLLTSLDVLTAGTYLRLPSCIKSFFIPKPPLTDAEVATTLKDVEDLIRFRLCVHERVPVEMARYRIADGRVYFTVPNLFRTSLCLRGARPSDGWFFVHVEFLHLVGGDSTGVQEFPREPPKMLKQHIADEANGRLIYYLPLPPDTPPPPPGVEIPPRPQLPIGTVDAPLFRLFNFLQMMSLAYQLEILFFQAQRTRSLGWAEYLSLEKGKDAKSFVASYWLRRTPNAIPGSTVNTSGMGRFGNIPNMGGTITISITQSHASPKAGGGPARSPKERVLAELDRRRGGAASTGGVGLGIAGIGTGFMGSEDLGGVKLSDEVESLRLVVRWDPTQGALGVGGGTVGMGLTEEELVMTVDPQDLDFEKLLRRVTMMHIRYILGVIQQTLCHYGPTRSIFSQDEVHVLSENGSHALKVQLCADEVVVLSIEPRTGRFTLRDSGDLTGFGRGPRGPVWSERINENPRLIYDALVNLRYITITESAEKKAAYLGLQTFRTRNFSREEQVKWGPPSVRPALFIQLANFPRHYLVLVINNEAENEQFRFALIGVQEIGESMTIEDIGWLDVARIRGTTKNRERGEKIKLETDLLRELYVYCCARVSYTRIELQFKLRGIPYQHVQPPSASMSKQTTAGHHHLAFNPIWNSHPQPYHSVTSPHSSTVPMGYPPNSISPPPLSSILYSALSHAVPGLCVQSSHILAGAPAAEAAMENIRVIALNWWGNKKLQVITCVKLKYVQQPIGKRSNHTTGGGDVIRPSKRIIYDTREAVVSFLSENVDTCVDQFLEEWAKVSKMVVIAREVSRMQRGRKGWDDVRLLSFDLRAVEFAYAGDYTVLITCTDQLVPSNNAYELWFSRACSDDNKEADAINPHEDAEPFLRNMLKHGSGLLSSSLRGLVTLLRDTLPIAVEMEEIRRQSRSESEETRGGVRVDAFAKGAGWYRVLYVDQWHALDFRLMRGRRVCIMDAGYGVGVLKPIPGFSGIVQEAIREAAVEEEGELGRVAYVDSGVICGVGVVGLIGRRIHVRVCNTCL